MPLTCSEIIEMYEKRAGKQYGGEAISQLEHALQCANLADQAGETDETVVAALLHDIGHLIASDHPKSVKNKQEHDDLHQFIALPFLRGVFSDAVLEPIRLHVDAKRYLCGVEPGYWATLSEASKSSLQKQGGSFTGEEIVAFMRQPFAEESIRLRRYDDSAKVPQRQTPDIAYFSIKLKNVMV